MTIVRVLAAAALTAAAVLPAVSASATQCDPKRGCSGSCYVNPDFTGPHDLFRCYS